MKILSSFRAAFSGLYQLLRSERNAQIEFCMAICAICAGFWLHITTTEWLIVLICIGSVLAAEAFNTALETTLDHLHPEKHALVGKAKDVSAAAVLILALISAVVGLMIFGPYVIQILL
ncbi:MAG: diacylglycerol kinase family protein [Flavobacteriales bacterium]|nr:diacylglycerol kinase family protein [Flavobacteriales bacterium]